MLRNVYKDVCSGVPSQGAAFLGQDRNSRTRLAARVQKPPVSPDAALQESAFEARNEKLATLMTAIAKGSYSVSSKDLAEKLMGNMLGEY